MKRDEMNHGITFINGGFRPAIAKPGRKWTRVVYIDGHRVRVKRTKEALTFRPIDGYTLKKLAIRMSRRTNALGVKMTVTKGARVILEEARHG